MRALVVEKPGELVIKQVEPQRVKPNDVKIRSVAFGICGTDIEIFQGLVPSEYVNYPVVPGHEWSGVIDEVGEDVKHLNPGDRVISEGLVPCGYCSFCKTGQTNLCENYDQIGFTRYGGGAEYVVVPAKNVHRIPDSLSHESSVLIEPAACILNGILRTPMEPGMTVAVIGPGTLGLLAVQIFKAFGAGDIILIGRDNKKLEFGKEIGATKTINIEKTEGLESLVKEWTNGVGADIVMETAGNANAVLSSLNICRKGGHVILEGLAGEGEMLTLPSDLITLRDLTIQGVFSYTTEAWTKMLSLIKTGKVDVEPLVQHRYPLEEYQQAYDLFNNRSKVQGKVVITHGKGEDIKE